MCQVIGTAVLIPGHAAVQAVPHCCLTPPSPPPSPLLSLQGLRKPAAEAYQVVAATLQVEPARVVFVDDRQANVDGAVGVGMRAVRFQSAAQLEQELLDLGLRF
jgi:hypothetical protein